MISVMMMSPCRDGEELDSQGDASSQPDTISIASRTSQNTLDSDKVGTHSPQVGPSHCFASLKTVSGLWNFFQVLMHKVS